MANKIVDISKFISADKPQMVLFGKTYTINNDKKTILLLDQLQREIEAGKTKKDETADEQILKLLIDGNGAQEIIKVLDENPNYAENEKVVMLNVMALATGREVAELEENFRKATR